MCANWTLHSQLDNATVQGLLRELNDFLINAEIHGEYNIVRHPSLKKKLCFVTSLQDELSDFLNAVGIDSTIHTDNSAFRNLLRIFGQVIEDTPLLCKPNSPLLTLVKYHFQGGNLSSKMIYTHYHFTGRLKKGIRSFSL